MPTYSYRCTECSNAFDVQQSFTDDSLTVCPSCNGVLRKVFSPIGVSFTGSGFYRNDSRPTPSEGKNTSSTESSSSVKASETKTATPAKPAKDSAPSKSAASSGTKSASKKPST